MIQDLKTILHVQVECTELTELESQIILEKQNVSLYPILYLKVIFTFYLHLLNAMSYFF